MAPMSQTTLAAKQQALSSKALLFINLTTILGDKYYYRPIFHLGKLRHKEPYQPQLIQCQVEGHDSCQETGTVVVCLPG